MTHKKTQEELFQEAEERGRALALAKLDQKIKEEHTDPDNKDPKDPSDSDQKHHEEKNHDKSPDQTTMDATLKEMRAMMQMFLQMQQGSLQTDSPSQQTFMTPQTSQIRQHQQAPPQPKFDVFTEQKIKPQIDTDEIELRKTLRSELIRFDGSRNVVLLDNFCRRLETYFDRCALSEQSQVIFAVTLLTRTAETWAAANSFSDFASFKRALIRQFRPPNASGEARTQLIDLRQRGSVRSYLGQFQDIALLVDQLSDVEKNHYFVKGLKPAVRLAVKTTPEFARMTFLDITERAITVDEANFEESRLSSRAYEQPRQVNAVTTTDANAIRLEAKPTTSAPGATDRPPKMTPEIKQWCRDNKACFFCREPQAKHSFYNCPKKAATLSKNY